MSGGAAANEEADEMVTLIADGEARGAGAMGLPLMRLDLRLTSVRHLGRQVSDARLRARREAQAWRVDIASNEISGRVKIPHDARQSGEPIRVRLDWVDLALMRPAGDSSDPGTGLDTMLDPLELPALDVRIERLKTMESTYTDGVLVTGPAGGGMTIHRLEFAAADMRVQGQGTWRGGDSTATRLRLSIRSGNFGSGLTAIGYRDTLAGGDGEVKADIEWPGAPWAPSVAGLSGHARIEVADGLIRQVDPGAARLLGLFTLSALPFRGLVEGGLGFSEIKGRIDFADGNAYTNNLRIDSDFAEIKIRGRTGLVARDYDQRITVQPELSRTLPLIGLLSGGPAAGVAVALVQTVMRNLGGDVEEVTERVYTLTGSWDDPKVQRADAVPAKAPVQTTDQPGRGQ